jgi:hypothetical protein
MPANLPESEWETLTRALQQTIDAWRQTHPTATLDEIEAIIDTQLAPARAKLVEATAHDSPRQDWQPGEAAAPPLLCQVWDTPGAPRAAPTAPPDHGRGQHRVGADVRSLSHLRARAFSPSLRNWD